MVESAHRIKSMGGVGGPGGESGSGLCVGGGRVPHANAYTAFVKSFDEVKAARNLRRQCHHFQARMVKHRIPFGAGLRRRGNELFWLRTRILGANKGAFQVKAENHLVLWSALEYLKNLRATRGNRGNKKPFISLSAQVTAERMDFLSGRRHEVNPVRTVNVDIHEAGG
jgi:hypothetical protein